MEKRIDGHTPNGGDYTIVYYMNDLDDSVLENEATKAIICEYDNNGDVIAESFLDMSKDNDIRKVVN